MLKKITITSKDINRFSGFKVAQQMASMDNVINQFPASSSDVKQWHRQWIKSKLESFIGNSIAEIPLTEQLYRRYVSMRDRSPGRLYSFLVTK